MKTHGKITFEGRRWAIECEPHVQLRLKRIFQRVSKTSHATVLISDTEEMCRELLWFLDRYPLSIAPKDAAYLQARAKSHRVRESEIERLLSGKYVAPSFDLAVPAREYQKIAAQMVLVSGSLLLADDVGLGKTASAICTFTDRRTLPMLVVTLAHLPKQWEAEINRFAPKLKTHVLRSGTPYDLRARVGRPRANQLGVFDPELPDVIIASYHKLSGWTEVLAKIVKGVVFDECQELRHEKHGQKLSKKYEAAKHIAQHAEFRMGLSATPIYNYGGEIYNVLQVIKPDALGTRGEFVREWCTDGGTADKARIKDPKSFGTYARDAGLMLRRTRSDVGRELPALTKIPHHIDLDEAVLRKIEGSAGELARIILTQRGTSSPREEQMQASSEFTNLLRQQTGIAKAPFVADFVRLLVESGEKVVLYGWHREVYSIWKERLADLNPVLYTGSESATQKEEAKAAFLSGRSQVLLISLRSGAGLDGLQSASRTVVFGELDWSPGVHEQCVGRVFRDGQASPVLAYFLVAESGADPVIADVLQLKKAQSDGVRDPHAELLKDLQVDPNHVKRLAEDYLRKRGMLIPSAAMERAS